MSNTRHGNPEDEAYRELIDVFVEQCREELTSVNVRAGVWHPNANPKTMPEEHERNLLLQSLSPSQRETLVEILTREDRAGVSRALTHLSERGIKPFDAAYEGTPSEDFLRRLEGWQWPARGRLRA